MLSSGWRPGHCPWSLWSGQKNPAVSGFGSSDGFPAVWETWGKPGAGATCWTSHRPCRSQWTHQLRWGVSSLEAGVLTRTRKNNCVLKSVSTKNATELIWGRLYLCLSHLYDVSSHYVCPVWQGGWGLWCQRSHRGRPAPSDQSLSLRATSWISSATASGSVFHASEEKNKQQVTSCLSFKNHSFIFLFCIALCKL